MLAKMIISGFLSKVHSQTLGPAATIASGILARLNDTGGKPMNMKLLLSGVAVIAALSVSAPVLAQRAGGNSSGGNSMGVPGPNPGGPNTPGTVNAGSFGQTSSPPPASSSAMPPMHHHGHHVTHAAAYHHQRAPLTGDTANQLNQQELARIQSGSSMPPPAPMGAMPPPPAPGYSPSGGNSMGMPGPDTGGPGLTPYSGGVPQR